MFEKIRLLITPPDFGDEEKNRIAEILNTIALSILSGYTILALQRAIAGHSQFFVQMLAAGILIALSIVFLRKGLLQWSETILVWTLLGFITFLMYTSDGLRSVALLGIPICLVFAGISLRPQYFYAYTILTVFAVIGIGYFEISGSLIPGNNHRTTYLDLIDIIIILCVTAIAVRILVKNLFRSIQKARAREKQMSEQTQVLR